MNNREIRLLRRAYEQLKSGERPYVQSHGRSVLNLVEDGYMREAEARDAQWVMGCFEITEEGIKALQQQGVRNE